MSEGYLSRKVAFDLLRQVLIQKQPLDQVLAQSDSYKNLEGRDRNFVRMLVSTCLRHKGQMDDLIQRCLDKPQTLKPETLNLVFYIGISQILFMEVADHAAVDLSVRLAEEERMERQKGFVNAVLRRIIREGQNWAAKQDKVTSNIPQWLLEQWIKDYGLQEAALIGEASLSEAALDITVKKPEEAQYWADELGGVVLPTGSIRLQDSSAIPSMKGFEEGAWWVQDASSALPVSLLGDLSNKTVIDLCAAPGGKTAQLVSKGAKVIAVDRSAKRLERLKENMERLGFQDSVEVAVSDGSVYQVKEPVDMVLIDAPCSATGTLRRHPDVMHLKSAQDVERLCAIQQRLLDNAASLLKPNGILLYCTCSLQKIEGEKQIDNFLNDHPDFKIEPFDVKDEALKPLLTAEGFLRILPSHLTPHGGMDGFFAARLAKK